MRGLFIPGITTEMFMNGCLESIETLMAEGEIYDIEYSLEQAQKDDRVKTELNGIKAELKQDACGDYISRAEVLKAFDDKFLELQKTKQLPENKTAEDKQLGVNWCINTVKDLPSVNPQEPKTDGDCISRAEAIYLADELKHDLPDNDKLADEVMAHNEGILEYQTKLSLLPSVQPKADQEPKTGHWIFMEVSSGRESWKCSECGRRARGKLENLPYCHCGAKMEG